MSWLLPPLEPHFVAALRDVHADGVAARVAAARRLERPEPQREAEARGGLRTLLTDHAAPVRAAAISSIATIGRAEDHPDVAALLEDADPLVRELAVIAIAQIEHPRREAVLRGALTHRSPEVRFQALQACAALFAEHIADDALALSRDEDPKLREAATRALSALPTSDGKAHARLLSLLDDPAPQVRWEAALGLAPQQEAAAVHELITSLEQNDRLLDTLDALAHYRLDNVRVAVQDVANSVLKSPLVVAAAARTLLKMGERAPAIASLRRVLRALRTDGRNLALQTIAEWLLTELGPELQRLARRPRGVDPEQLVDTVRALAEGWPAGRTVLTQLARRRGALGDAARAAQAKVPAAFWPGSEPEPDHSAP